MSKLSKKLILCTSCGMYYTLSAIYMKNNKRHKILIQKILKKLDTLTLYIDDGQII